MKLFAKPIGSALAGILLCGAAFAQGAQMGQTDQSGSAGNQMSNQHEETQASSDQLRKIQSYLDNKGYSVKVDGVWGPQTSQAVEQFQKANNLQATGHLNPETLAAMNLELGRAPASKEQGTNQNQTGGQQGSGAGMHNEGQAH